MSGLHVDDLARIASLRERVEALLRAYPGRRFTLGEIRAACGGSETSVSARLRDLRKERYGGHRILGERQRSGVWWYWYERPRPEEPVQLSLT